MAELQLKSERFRAEREADWRRLEALLAKFEKGGASRLSRAELLDGPVLYRQALSSLSVARSISESSRGSSQAELVSQRGLAEPSGVSAGTM